MIVLTEATFKIYHANNSSMHEPIKKSQGWLDTQEYTNTTRVKHQKRHKKASSNSDTTSEPQASEQANLVASNGTKNASQAKLANSSVEDAKTVDSKQDGTNGSSDLVTTQDGYNDKTRDACYRKFQAKVFNQYYQANNENIDLASKQVKDDFNKFWNDPEKKNRLLNY